MQTPNSNVPGSRIFAMGLTLYMVGNSGRGIPSWYDLSILLICFLTDARVLVCGGGGEAGLDFSAGLFCLLFVFCLVDCLLLFVLFFRASRSIQSDPSDGTKVENTSSNLLIMFCKDVKPIFCKSSSLPVFFYK